MAITVSRADAYFRNGTMWRAWNEYAEAQKEAGLEQAKRELAKAIRRPMKEDEAEYAPGDTKRDEYAVYEQALFCLLRDCQPVNTAGTAVPSLEPDAVAAPGERLVTGGGEYSERALSWLCDKLSVTTVLA